MADHREAAPESAIEHCLPRKMTLGTNRAPSGLN